MKRQRPNLTKDQRKRLFLLARLLDRVPKKHFDMSVWVTRPNKTEPEHKALHKVVAGECGYAACAIGWGMTSRTIRGSAGCANELKDTLIGWYVEGSNGELAWPQLFGSQRSVGPKRVAADIRRYLKNGTLPTS